MANSDDSFRTLIRDLIAQVAELVRQEVRLAQAEAGQKAHKALFGLVGMIAGLLFVQIALIVLAEGIVAALAATMPIWTATAIVAVATLAIGAAIFLIGLRSVRPKRLVPERTLRTLRDDKDFVAEQVG